MDLLFIIASVTPSTICSRKSRASLDNLIVEYLVPTFFSTSIMTFLTSGSPISITPTISSFNINLPSRTLKDTLSLSALESPSTLSVTARPLATSPGRSLAFFTPRILSGDTMSTISPVTISFLKKSKPNLLATS